MTTIVTNESFTEATLLSLIVENNVDGLKSFLQDIESAMDANWCTFDYNLKIIRALEAAGFKESDQYKQLSNVNKDIAGTNNAYNEFRNRASFALSELA